MKLLKYLESLNDRTPWLKGIKENVPFRDLFYDWLVRQRNRHLAEKQADLFDDHYIEDKLECLPVGKQPMFYILLPEAIGDLIACEPLTRHLKSLAPNGKIKWLVKRSLAQVLETNPLIDKIVPIDFLKQGLEICERAEQAEHAIVLWCRLNRTPCAKTGYLFYNKVNPFVDASNYYSLSNLLGAFCLASGIRPLDMRPHFCLAGTQNITGLTPKSYVVFHCNSSDPSRNWIAEKWKRLAAWLNEHGERVVEIGTERVVDSDDSLYLDCTGQKRIPDLVRVISEAKFLVGCDSCFAHAANAVKTSAVVLLGKYRVWDSYNPYSGAFARDCFKIVRAASGKKADSIEVESVIKAICQLRTGAESHTL